MTIAELGSLGEFVGSVAVLVTLIYLAIQVRQNSKITRMQMIQDAASSQQLVIMRAMDDDMASNQEDPLWWKQILWIEMNLRGYESTFLQLQEGLFEPELFDAKMLRMKNWFATERAIQLWYGVRLHYHPEFRSYVDELLVGIEPTKALYIFGAVTSQASDS